MAIVDDEAPVDRLIPAKDMKLRDYFAAHAPKKPQTWFRPTMPQARPAAIHGCSHGAEHKPGCHFEWCSPDNWQEIAQWDADERVATLKQWPYVWADAMLTERSK